MKLTYTQELGLQLPGDSINDYDALVELENRIISGLGNLGHVDGHDMGLGQTNVLIRTDHPMLAFERIRSLLGDKNLVPELKAAYREIGKEDFSILFPTGLRHFSIS